MSGPKKGGTHPIFGLYIGGDALTASYASSSPDSKSNTTQLRSVNELQIAENFLHSQKNNTTSLKFNGRSDVIEENSISLSEFIMEAFSRSVVGLVESFGIDTFFYIMDIDGSMKYLQEEPHHFTLELVQAEHSSWLVEPEHKFIGVGEAWRESTKSVNAHFKCYDEFEKCDFSLSRDWQLN